MAQGYGSPRPARPVSIAVASQLPPRGGDPVGEYLESRTGLHRLRRLIVAREIGEARDRGFELQTDGAGRAVALLADDDLGFAVGGVHLDLPLDVLVRAGPRLLV